MTVNLDQILKGTVTFLLLISGWALIKTYLECRREKKTDTMGLSRLSSDIDAEMGLPPDLGIGVCGGAVPIPEDDGSGIGEKTKGVGE